jgi:gliding motility-associated-like protein
MRYYLMGEKGDEYLASSTDARGITRIKDLTNGKKYSFIAVVYGHYEHRGIHRPIVCLSQEVNVIPTDNEVECPPQLSITQDCSLIEPFSLHWISPAQICNAEGIDSFIIYHRDDDNMPWEELHRTTLLEYDIPLEKRYGEYMVKARGSAGNTSAESNAVSVIRCENISLPNVFTPNGDGINDLFVPLTPIEEGDFHIDIFSRWGIVVFSTSNPNIMWNGTVNGNGNECSEGVYFYVYSFTPIDGSQAQKGSGYVHLFRQ